MSLSAHFCVICIIPVLGVCNPSPEEAETGTSVGLANCQPSLLELQAGERNDG